MALVQMLLTTSDIFQIAIAKRRMEKLLSTRLAREKFLEDVKEAGGDFHYFKKQEFGPAYKRTVFFKFDNI